MKVYNFCKTCNKKTEQYLFEIISRQTIDLTNFSENDFSILPDRILSELGFSKFDGQFTKKTCDIGTLFYFLRNKNKDFIQEELNNTICAFGISCELEKLKRKKKIRCWESRDPLDLKALIKIEQSLDFEKPGLL
ncbi:hypothetical protein BuS5_04024 (plasmid) [Desulfosarcina sp. BuS5]|uniref:hypothetical protein n=1 Tax=Desulfosarcina sp. BuS5 TaxID=933262 RepID=UPI000486583B|nr:hypothetical protein [Desulfosarcina sp. BuS5]WDN91052.1 hypothetical protein BuS5_04024 [Desulfosarcina sp. BuS5]